MKRCSYDRRPASRLLRVTISAALLSLSIASARAAAVAETAVKIYLEYREVPSVILQQEVTVLPVSTPFRKEPDFGRDKVLRGQLSFGNDAQNAPRFAWNQSQRKLYLDLNRNEDVTDDAGGVFTSGPEFPRHFQVFTNVHLAVGPPQAPHPNLVDLSLRDAGDRPGASAGLRSLWQGRISLDGQDWQVGLVESVSHPVGNMDGSFLLVRPWDSRARPLNLFGASLDGFSFSRHLFFHNQAYGLDCAFETSKEKPRFRLEWRVEHPQLGELMLKGEFIRRLLFSGAEYTVVLDSPGPVLSLPYGTYGEHQVSVGAEGVEASRDALQDGLGRGRVAIGRDPASLTTGGPLTNSVVVTRRGKHAVLNYRLVGADGTSSYRLANQDVSNPPRFTIYKDGKEIHSGKFEFG